MNDLVENKVYQSLRTVLAAVAIISLANVFMIKFEVERNLLFSAFLPSWGANHTVYFAPELNGNMAIACGVGVIALLYLCYVLSKKHYGWMMLAFIIYLIDTWVMIWFIDARGYSYAQWALDIAAHVIVLVLLLWAAMIGKNRKKEKPVEAEPEPAEEKTENKIDYIIED